MDHYIWRGKVGEAFWTTASLVSLVINVILVAVIILLAREVFTIKRVVHHQVIGGLYDNFTKMDQSHIVTTIQVSDTITVQDNIPVVFNLPLKQETTVVLTRDTPIRNATIFLNGRAVPLDIILKKGSPLYIALDMVVPVNQTIPVVLNVPVDLSVPVDIDLSQTDLHAPFVGLQNVVRPYDELLDKLPDTYDELFICNPLTNWWCRWFFGSE
jgi:hypothetical protein